MVPDRDRSERARLAQTPTSDQSFYAVRRKFVRNLPVWAASAGLGKEARLLELVVARSKPSDPFAWAVTGTQEEWAKSWGTSRPTLQRWLSELRSQGFLVGEVRPSPGLSGRRHDGVEYPVFSVPDWLVEQVSRWADPDYWPPVCKPQNEAYSLDPQAGDDSVDKDGIPVTARDVQDGVTQVTSSPNNRTRSTSTEHVDAGDRVTRRLRRRRIDDMKKWDDDGYDPPVLGQERDELSGPVPAQARDKKPSVQVAALFDQAWQEMLREHPGTSMQVGVSPWHGQKKYAYAWINKQLLPQVGNDMDLVLRIFQAFCTALVGGTEFLPNDMPPWRRLQQTLDKYARAVPVTETAEDRAEVEEENREWRQRLGEARRPKRPTSTGRPRWSAVDDPYFFE